MYAGPNTQNSLNTYDLFTVYNTKVHNIVQFSADFSISDIIYNIISKI